MGNDKTEGLADALLPAVDGLIEALEVEPDERYAFGAAAKALMADLRRELEARGLRWPPLVALANLERLLIAELDVDRAAAVATLRQYTAWARAEQASRN
jgi:hypothetical protein